FTLRICLNVNVVVRLVPAILVLFVLTFWPLHAQSPWLAVGPDGGDARSVTAVNGDPSHLYMGAINSWIYESTDAGASWRRLAKLDSADDLVVDHIFVDPGN